MLGFATFSALLPELRDAWRLTNAEAGMIGARSSPGMSPPWRTDR
jgi:hypothetical protein